MPDFAIMPELPAGYPIDSRRSVARLVSVQTVIVSSIPEVTIPAGKVTMHSYVVAMGVAGARPGDAPNVNISTPSMSIQATETMSAEMRRI